MSDDVYVQHDYWESCRVCGKEFDPDGPDIDCSGPPPVHFAQRLPWEGRTEELSAELISPIRLVRLDEGTWVSPERVVMVKATNRETFNDSMVTVRLSNGKTLDLWVQRPAAEVVALLNGENE